MSAKDETALEADTRVQTDRSFAALYRERYAAMVRLAGLLTGSGPVAEELVQDVFVRLYRRWGRIEEPGAYLRTAVINACRSHLRRLQVRRRHPPSPPEPEFQPEPDAMWDLLQRMPLRQRTALVLRFYEDLPFDQIAGILRCPTSTAKSLVHRGLQRLSREVSA